MLCKKFSITGIALGSVFMASTAATAAPVPRCYKLDPFIDVLRLVLGDVQSGQRAVWGNWIASGTYTIPVSGSFANEAGTTTKKLSITGFNTTTFFGDNGLCGLGGIPGGGWEINCAGGPGGTFQTSGTLTQVACGGLPTSAPQGKAAGQ